MKYFFLPSTLSRYILSLLLPGTKKPWNGVENRQTSPKKREFSCSRAASFLLFRRCSSGGVREKIWQIIWSAMWTEFGLAILTQEKEESSQDCSHGRCLNAIEDFLFGFADVFVRLHWFVSSHKVRSIDGERARLWNCKETTWGVCFKRICTWFVFAFDNQFQSENLMHQNNRSLLKARLVCCWCVFRWVCDLWYWTVWRCPSLTNLVTLSQTWRQILLQWQQYFAGCWMVISEVKRLRILR